MYINSEGLRAGFMCFLGDIPRHGQCQPLADALGGRVAQQALCLADVGQAVANVTGAKVAVDG